MGVEAVRGRGVDSGNLRTTRTLVSSRSGGRTECGTYPVVLGKKHTSVETLPNRFVSQVTLRPDPCLDDR